MKKAKVFTIDFPSIADFTRACNENHVSFLNIEKIVIRNVEGVLLVTVYEKASEK